jgi:hypothetical protein
LCNANGPSTPGLQSLLAISRRPMLPSSLHKPWAESERKQRFRSSIPFRAGQLIPAFHPRYLSVYASTALLPVPLQHSILGLWLRVTLAGAAPARLQAISSPHVHILLVGQSCFRVKNGFSRCTERAESRGSLKVLMVVMADAETSHSTIQTREAR